MVIRCTPQGEDEASTILVLLGEVGWDMVDGVGDYDGVEGGALFPPEIPIRPLHVDITVSKPLQSLLGALSQRLPDLNGVDLLTELGEHSCLVAS